MPLASEVGCIRRKHCILLNRADIQQILQWPEYKGLVVVDEAYIDFCDFHSDSSKELESIDEKTELDFRSYHENGSKSVSQWVKKQERLVVMQTLSKSFGLAGIRLGVAIAGPEIIHYLYLTKSPYNISLPTSELALRALTKHGIQIMRDNTKRIHASKLLLHEQLTSLEGVTPVIKNGGDANFVLIRIMERDNHAKPDNKRAHAIYKHMAEEMKIVVRFRGNELGLAGCLRVTVGTEDGCQKVVEGLRAAMKML